MGLAILVPGRVFPQQSTDCETDECRRVSGDLAEAAGRIRDARTDFVQALRGFVEALAGTYGDEGPTLRRNVATLGESLGRWDRAVRAYQAPVAAVTGNADVHVALGTVQFERGRPRAAADEWAEAGRLAPGRLDVFLLLGLAHDATGRHAESAAAFEKASALAPAHAAARYALAQQAWKLGQPDRAVAALRAFHGQVRPPGPAASRGQSPFLRGGLLRESAGVAPIFPPARYVPGFEALARGAYPEAVAQWEKAIARDPLAVSRSGEAGRALAAGSAALRAGDLRAALTELEASVRTAPDLTEARRLLAMALRADERPAEAVAHLQAAVRLDPSDERARVALARDLVDAGRPLEAEQALRDTVASLPASAQARFELGRLYQALERPLEAAAAFAAAEPFVGQERIHELVGRLRLAEADFDGAIVAFRRRIDASPNHADAHRTLGETYLQLGRHDEALAEFAAALLVDPTDAQAHAGRAQVHLRMGRYEEAASAARAALERDANHLGALYALGTSLLRLGQAPAGSAAMERFQTLQAAARERDQRVWELKLLRQTAWMDAEAGRLEEAVARLREALEAEPTADAYLGLGVVLKRAGRHQESLDALERAATLGAGPDVHVHLAEVYAALGRPEDGRRQQLLRARAIDERFRARGGR